MIEQLAPLIAVVVAVGVATIWYRRATGVARPALATFRADELRRLGVHRRQRAVVLFTSPGCSSCAAAKRVLEPVARRHGVAVVVADVTDHADIAAAQHVYRAPTVFVVDEQGRALTRISGVPRDHELERVLTSGEPEAVDLRQ